MEDMAILQIDSSKVATFEAIVIGGSDDEDHHIPVSAPAKAIKAPIVRPKNDWKKWPTASLRTSCLRHSKPHMTVTLALT